MASYSPTARRTPRSGTSNLKMSRKTLVGMICTSESTIERIRAVAIGKYSAGVQLERCLIRDSLLIGSGETSRWPLWSSRSSSAASGTAIATSQRSLPVSKPWPSVRPTSSSLAAPDTLNVRTQSRAGRSTSSCSESVGPGLAIDLPLQLRHDEMKRRRADRRPRRQPDGAPLFVDAAKGDYREAAGSPTIDAGAADQLAGSLDLAGNARILGVGARHRRLRVRSTACRADSRPRTRARSNRSQSLR